MASPHTRGWTGQQTFDLLPVLGFPAHAGMDHARGAAGAIPRRLPRTRGDGPRNRAPLDRCSMASPHTRGWTPGRPTSPARRPGFPAHAGMDPLCGGRGCVRPRLPRTRGDGPVAQTRLPPASTASPHTRGWTWARLCGRRSPRGFPAHAGMDPGTRRSDPSPRRLPRTRGDGPVPDCGSRQPSRASPHTRGWTPGRSLGRRGGRGFPAHAGMDPAPAHEAGSAGGLPRTRGDGPAAITTRRR